MPKKGQRLCKGCFKFKDDVEDGLDPFMAEIYNEEIPVTWCGDCYREAADEI